MNELLRRLSGGDLRSDGRANEVADEVLGEPALLKKLLAGLSVPDDVVRARTAHALERISRIRPDLLQGRIFEIVEPALADKVPMVRWHLAMILGSRAVPEKDSDRACAILFALLQDASVFVKGWAISSLAIWGKERRGHKMEIIHRLRALQKDPSVAIQSRVAKALNALEKEDEPIPKGWLKDGDVD